MMQFVNNLVSNFTIINFIYAIAYIVENYLFLTMLLLVFNVKASTKQKLFYMLPIIPINIITSIFLESPFNVFINYTFMTIMISIIFKLNILKSLTSLLVSIFIFGLLNILIQNPYLTILDITHAHIAVFLVFLCLYIKPAAIT